MPYRIEGEQLKALYTASKKPCRPQPSDAGRATLQRIGRKGWALTHEAEDLVLLTDRRLDDWKTQVDLEKVAAGLSVPTRSVTYRPRARSGGASLFEAWPALDFASLLIALEALGFSIDPSPLVEMVLPTLPKAGLMPALGLDVVWYGKMRHKIKLHLALAEPGKRGERWDDYRNDAGYRFSALLDADGEPIELTVTGPKYRERRPPVETICPDCGVTWYRGDPDSSASHRKEHKARMQYLAPAPSEAMAAETIADREHVDWRSPRWKHEEMYGRALAFKREFRYDFTQWDCPERDRDAHGFLFTDGDDRIVGACAFRLREWEDGSKSYGLQFIWIAPGHRRGGVLRDRWADLRRRFGDFYIETPVSPAMRAFVIGTGDALLLEYPTRRGASAA